MRERIKKEKGRGGRARERMRRWFFGMSLQRMVKAFYKLIDIDSTYSSEM